MSANEHEVPCPMPDCGEPLAITWFLSYGLHPTDLVDTRIVPEPDWHHVSTYEIGCNAGHVIVLPPDDGGDSYDLDEDAIERLRLLMITLSSDEVRHDRGNNEGQNEHEADADPRPISSEHGVTVAGATS